METKFFPKREVIFTKHPEFDNVKVAMFITDKDTDICRVCLVELAPGSETPVHTTKIRRIQFLWFRVMVRPMSMAAGSRSNPAITFLYPKRVSMVPAIPAVNPYSSLSITVRRCCCNKKNAAPESG